MDQEHGGRVKVDGKFFRLGTQKFSVKGVTYGPFAPNANGEMLPASEQTRQDFKLIHQLGANVVRVYYVPPRWLLDLAGEAGLKVFVDIPWGKHLCFLDSSNARAQARRAVREGVGACREHAAVFAVSVVNEIPPEIVRWSGVRRLERFLSELIEEAKSIDPDCLYTCASFPPTEFLQCENSDFVCFNVYLHEPKSFRAYLGRLQTLANARPLVLGELGMDSIRHGEAGQAEFLHWQIELAFRCGLAGTVVFSFTDDWFRGGMQIDDWGFGLTTRERKPKAAFDVVRSRYRSAPHFPLPRIPKVTVVVATYNGSRTLRPCLEALGKLTYPDYEVLVVDDGSTDNTAEIAGNFPFVRCLRQSNQGLSAARNAGIRAAHGEIVAFTDDDCRPDEDWLHYLVQDLLDGNHAGIGGHNFLPPDDSPVGAVVMASPGGPAHVLLTDREAEHIPGCNMAFYRRALEQVGLFDPVFRKAGDDVDLCWRLLDSQLKIGFSPAGFVWHYRRSTVKAYLKQQAGYGEAEALLIGKHPEHYNPFGGGVWRGRIYSSFNPGLLLQRPVIYHGIFGSAFFQKIYAPPLASPFLHCVSLPYQVLVNLPLLALAVNFRIFIPLAAASLGLTLGTCVLAAVQAPLPPQKKRFWSRPLVGLLFLLQPLVRDWARIKARAQVRSPRRPEQPLVPARARADTPEIVCYWSARHLDRFNFLERIARRLEAEGWAFRLDTGWAAYDLEIVPWAWSRLRLTTTVEELEQGKRNLRCRLQSAWSAPARLIAALVIATVALLILWLGARFPWMWYSLVSVPLLGWIFEDGGRRHRQELASVMNAIAREDSLIEVE